MRVLVVEHGALVSGGQHSLIEYLRGLPADVTATVACPPTGPLADELRRYGIGMVPLRGTDGSFRLHPVHTPRLVVDLVRMGRAIRRLARETGADVVHANSIRAGLACAAGLGLRRPARTVTVVVHLRDSLPANAAGRGVRRVLAATADALIAISEHTARTFGAGPRVHVAHNPVDLVRFSPDGPAAPVAGSPVLAVIGQITPWKAQDDAIRILAGLREHAPAARLLIVGEAKFLSASTRYDNRAYEAALHALVDELGVGDAVDFLGERADIPELLRACDVVLVPSWEEPFGRTIIEALATGTPVVATAAGGPPEILAAGAGTTVAPRRPDLWVDAIRELLAASPAVADVRACARPFATPGYVERVLGIYADSQP